MLLAKASQFYFGISLSSVVLCNKITRDDEYKEQVTLTDRVGQSRC